MTPEYEQEITANLERAKRSLQAARDLVDRGYHDFAASRAYYAPFYGATAVLLNEGLEFSKHRGVLASIHQRFVKTGKLSRDHAKDLNWLFEYEILVIMTVWRTYLGCKRSRLFKLHRISCKQSNP